MKAFSKVLIIILCAYVLSACHHEVVVETVVHPDGSLDRNITLLLEDSAAVTQNIFGINEAKGWKASIRKLSEEEINRIKNENESNDGDFMIEFSKNFPSVAEANQEMNSGADTLFHIKSSFEERFRWFYTYVRYSDTYAAANRFRYVEPEEFFTPEDHAFINRLPSDTRFMSRADSVYLKWLNSKIEEDFAKKGYYEEFFHLFLEALKRNNVQERWLDTMKKYKEPAYNYMLLSEDKKTGQDTLDFDFLFRVADTLHIPVVYQQTRKDFEDLVDQVKPRTDFMDHVINGSYLHTITMPWPVIATNADSVTGSQVSWRPHYLKFAFNDYVMYAESRKINYTPVAASVVLVGFSAVLVIRRRKKRFPG